MVRTVEAIVDKEGRVRLLEAVHLPAARRALVTILEDEPRAEWIQEQLKEMYERLRDR